jgi:uncharacterized protein YjbI with pentapeptide repeats
MNDLGSVVMTSGTEAHQNSKVETNAQRNSLSKEQIREAVAAHRSWIESGHTGGHRANFRGLNLEGIDLRELDLQGADLSEANLRGADLGGADLHGANLRDANLETADLSGVHLEKAVLVGTNLRKSNLLHATLRTADLQDADLTGARGLICAQLAGTNLSGAKLPDAVAQFETLHHIEATAHIARPMFIIMLLLCVYSIATIISTSDLALLSNSPSTILPEMGTPIPTAGFYIAAPIILFSLYMYMHLYLRYLCEDITYLPSVFPDGVPIYKRVYPWILVTLAAQLVYAPRSEKRRRTSLLMMISNAMMVFCVWWLVPLMLLIFWARYLPAQNWYGTILHVVLFVVSSGSGGLGPQSYRLAHAKFLWPEKQSILKKFRLRDPTMYQGAAAAVAGVIVITLSLGSLYGVRTDRLVFSDVRTWAPGGFALIGFSPYADFRKKDISQKPENWMGTENDLIEVTGVELREINLRNADAFDAFLVKADFRGSDLEGSIFATADLRLADLRNANLRMCDFFSANLKDANLRGANLQESMLNGANLQGARLVGADLQNALLGGVDLQWASLGGANMRGVDLRGANLNGARLANAQLQEALLFGATLQQTDFRNADLQNADLKIADLQSAALSFANLSGANLRGASFQGASLFNTRFDGAEFGAGPEGRIYEGTNFRGADLRHAHGITQQQLNRACGDAQTRLPHGLTIELCED